MLAKKTEFLNIARSLVISGLMLLAGCGALPTMVPDMAMRSTYPVQVNDARGPLTPQQSKAILAKLKKESADSNILDRHLALETAIAGSPLHTGNKVTLLIDGPETYNAMYAAIEKAKDHINLETFIIEDDEVGQLFANLLMSKQGSGVQVNLIYDSVGSIYTPKKFFDTLKESGVNVLEFNPVNPLNAKNGWQVNNRDHRKLLIVDGEIAFVGGVNISSVYSSGSFGRSRADEDNPPWRDTHLQIEGPVVSDFQKLFMATWEEQKGEPLAPNNYFPKLSNKGNDVVRAIGSSPERVYSQIYNTLLSAINNAESHVFLTIAYFVPDPQLLAALKNAAQRKVDVRLLLPGETDSIMVYHASRSYYDELLSAGVKIYERQNALLHAKTALIDGVWSTVGSTNLDWRSFLYNHEINAVILGKDFSEQMRTLFDRDLQHSTLVALHDWRKRPIVKRIKERAARMWALWL